MSIYRSKYAKTTFGKKVQRQTGGKQISPEQRTLQLSRLLREAGMQPKLKIGKPNDRYEQEADRVADRVLASPEMATAVVPVVGGITPLTAQRTEEEEAQTKPLLQCQEEEEEEEMQPKLQRQPLEEEEEMLQAKGEAAAAVPARLSTQVNALRGTGQPLPDAARTFFEPRFGFNFSEVRVHSGGQATEMARSVRARAFTVGQDLVFGAGQYAPATSVGRKLLAHELTHVVQQGGGRSGKLQPALEGSSAMRGKKSEQT